MITGLSHRKKFLEIHVVYTINHQGAFVCKPEYVSKHNLFQHPLPD